MVDYIAPFVNFAALLLVLWHFGRKPFGEFLASRSEGVAREINEARAEAESAGKLLGKWEGQVAAAQEHARKHEEDVRAQVEAQRARALEAARQQAERVRRDAALLGQNEAAKAREALQREVATRSVMAAERYVKSHLSEKDREQLLNEYLEILGNGSRS